MTMETTTVDNIDIYEPDNYVEKVPLADFATLRKQAPIHWHAHPDGSGYWVVSRHEDVVKVSKDFKTFSAQRGFVLVDDLPEEILERAQGQLLGMDPPNHGPIRRAVITRFTKKLLAELEPKVRSITTDILDKLEPRFVNDVLDCEFVNDIAGELPTSVIGSLLGVPQDMWSQLRRWSDLQTSASDPDIGGDDEETQNASVNMGAYGYQLAEERKGGDGVDLISLLINVEIEGHKVTEMEFASLFVQITVAGNETTRGLLAGGMLELIKHPHFYTELENDQSKLPRAIEEMLRWTCPLHYFRRTATCDTEIAGQAIKENDRVVMMYSSANFDETVFENPNEFDIHREHNPHLAFGYGIHLCLGANLARLETRVFYEEFFKRYKSIELIGEPKRIRSNLVNGLKHMPVRIVRR